jgi:hypothetical protein
MKRFQEAMNFFYKKHFKVSFFFFVFMKMGILFFSFVKMFQGKSKQKRNPQNYILVSQDEFLKDALENKLKNPIQLQKSAQFVFENKNSEVIFDQNFNSFKTIIDAFETNKNKGLSFKILPKSSRFLIGSNSSFDRGEVINF